ncbi:MAG TPA: phytoene desaturase family protein [Sporichthya sp.]|nr:phytoene desaturase family protein [Sporichthya sp.]
MARVVVVGAGLSGLAVATRLARLRHDVVICERADGPGGQAGRYEQDGFGFDTGPTHLTLPAGYRDLFIKTGKTSPLESVLQLEPVDPAVRWQFADGTTVDVPNATRAGTLEALTAAFGPGAAEDWDRFLAVGSDIWEVFRKGFLAAPPSRRLDALRSKEGRARVAALSPEKNLPTLTARHLRDPRLVTAAHSYALRLGSDPRHAAAAVALWPSMEHTFGTWRVDGGIRRLVDAMADRAASRGAKLRYQTPVAAILHERQQLRGVRLGSGETLPADIVVSAVDHSVTRDLLGERRARAIAPSVSAFTLLLALDGEGTLPPTISFSPDPDRELREVFGPPVPPSDPTVFLSPAEAPPGAAAWTVTVIVPRHGVPDGDPDSPDVVDWTDRATEAFARRVLDVLDRRGFGVSARLRWCEAHSPADVERRSGVPGGAIGGGNLHGLHGALFRPPNTTDLPGLYQVGGSAHPGPGLAFAPLGAALVAESIGRAKPSQLGR